MFVLLIGFWTAASVQTSAGTTFCLASANKTARLLGDRWGAKWGGTSSSISLVRQVARLSSLLDGFVHRALIGLLPYLSLECLKPNQ